MSRSEHDAHRDMPLTYDDGVRVGESKAMRIAERLSERAYDRGVWIGSCVGLIGGAFAAWFVYGWFS